VITAAWQISIARPQEQVFDFVADLRNEPQFNPDASNIVQETPGEIGLGTVYTEDFKRIGSFRTTIHRYERPGALGFDARNPRCDANVQFTFSPAGEGETDVGCTVTLTMKGFMRLTEGLAAGTVRKQISTRGPMLKRAVESQPSG
jgi:Polyketide cyclase / dehydrase and lipid transport